MTAATANPVTACQRALQAAGAIPEVWLVMLACPIDDLVVGAFRSDIAALQFANTLSLGECELLAKEIGDAMGRYDISEVYNVFITQPGVCETCVVHDFTEGNDAP